MNEFATIELSKEYLKFSSAHFTIFSSTERERLHGHNFSVSAKFKAPIDKNGLCFNYGDLKTKLSAICDSLDEYLLLPGDSPHLKIAHKDEYYLVQFAHQSMQFLTADTLVLPLKNISVEELAGYILKQLLNDSDIRQAQIRAIQVSVSSGPGQWGTRDWSAQDE